MIVVIFEVVLDAQARDRYMTIAEELVQFLESIDGFLSVERFQSLADPDKLLSLSTWKDETAVQAWREQMRHRSAQYEGRYGLFRGYRLRVASVIRDYGKEDWAQAPTEV
ncbi:antibiotic biosynthesis monooxygenase family protein [Saccharospirillum salsuginis]|uniref:Antibiotic biosynthesis monooxygenase n=1 Tax=Saccharospirillum salsuginis TaxID=418750 RepID=A0A918K0P8_9GAMM|nr:antibiotic biosynthesis monooxygenase [Saccharospirillum salsuginis]GGX39644.1 antibiotic biosynthesis monooxygenase [Saccharospirillum salsuginis]